MSASVTDEEAELAIGEVARECGVSRSTVRRWEERGWLTPARRLPGSGYRRYRATDVARLKAAHATEINDDTAQAS